MNALKRWAIAAGVLFIGRKRRRPLIDSASAAVLLQAWLEGRQEAPG